jgi:uncharacterized membrane protein YhiD involved in acid resistance
MKMTRALINVGVMLAGVAATLAAAGAIYLMTSSIEQMEDGVIRWLAIAAALCVGTGLLVASVFVAVKMAVVFGVRPNDPPPKTVQIDVRWMQEQARKNRGEGRA